MVARNNILHVVKTLLGFYGGLTVIAPQIVKLCFARICTRHDAAERSPLTTELLQLRETVERTIKLNLFSNAFRTEAAMRRQCWMTRIYLIAFLGEHLHCNGYSTALHVPLVAKSAKSDLSNYKNCSRIALPRRDFISVSRSIHQVCTIDVRRRQHWPMSLPRLLSIPLHVN